MKIATWNVNSINMRKEQVLTWLETMQPDVLALQEIKCMNDKFPYEAFAELGYQIAVSGQKSYNGVAILSKYPIENVATDIPGWQDEQRRILIATVQNVRILNVYVPNGSSVGSDKYQYKLNWLTQMEQFIKKELNNYPKFIMLGDFNIAPDDIDIHDPQLWKDSVLCSRPERDRLQAFFASGLTDLFRHLHPEQQFSWWDYREAAFRRNRGLRIDHILASQEVVNACRTVMIDKTPRAWEKPSDHAPVLMEFIEG
jgi:exodeoxyribonuclease-3